MSTKWIWKGSLKLLLDFPIPNTNLDDIEIIEEDTIKEVTLVTKTSNPSSTFNTISQSDTVTCPKCSKRGIHKLMLSSHMDSDHRGTEGQNISYGK